MRNIIFLCIAVLLAACHNKRENILTIGVLKGPSAISVAQWLQEAPVFNGEKLQVEIFNDVTALQAQMIQGKVDFAVLPTTVAAILYNKGVDYRMVACPVEGAIYVVSSERIKSFNDLRKKTVAVSGQGTTPDVLFTLLATKYNFRNKELQLDYKISSHAELAQAVASGKIRTALLPEPFVTLVTAKNSRIKAVINLSNELEKQDSTCLFALSAFVVNRHIAEQHPADVDSVASRYRKAIGWLQNHIPEAAEEMVKDGILPDKTVAEQSIPRCNIRYINAADNKQLIVNYLNIFLRFDPKTIGGSLPDSRFYYEIRKSKQAHP